MGERIWKWLGSLGLVLASLAVVAAAAGDGPKPGNVTEARLLAAEDDPDNWLAHGRTYAE